MGDSIIVQPSLDRRSFTMKSFTMKVAAVLLMSALATAAPADKGVDKGMVQVMVQCLAENWKEGAVEECIQCFKDLDKANSPEEGMAKGKKCVADYLPRADKDCSTEIVALAPSEEPKELLECFEKSLMIVQRELLGGGRSE